MGTERSCRAEVGPAQAAPGWWERIPRTPLAARAKAEVGKCPKKCLRGTSSSKMDLGHGAAPGAAECLGKAEPQQDQGWKGWDGLGWVGLG